MAADIELSQEDRLPWLETVESDEPEGPGAGRVIAAVVLALLLLAGGVFAVFKLTNHPSAPAVASGSGDTIAPPPGDYKVKPQDPGGLKVGGEGDTAVATSTGTGAPGRIDPKQVPEKPVASAAPKPAVTPTAPEKEGTRIVSAVPPPGGRLVVAAPVHPVHGVPGWASGGALVQLAAYPSEATANAAWSSYAKRFSYLATLGKVVQPAEVGGHTVYRLRVNAGSAGAAADICGRLKVAGEDCFVTAG
jgi:hypothetical protein